MNVHLENALRAFSLSSGDVFRPGTGRKRELLAFLIPGAQALQAWKTLRRVVPQSGLWPVIAGDPNRVCWCDDDPDRILREAESVDLDAVMARRADLLELAELERQEREHPIEWSRVPVRTEPRIGAHTKIDLATSQQRYLDRCLVALAPTTDQCTLPAYFVNADAEPSAAERIAFLRHWNRSYGPQIVAMNQEMAEMLVRNPPASASEARRVAKEHYLFCPETVEQGEGTLQALAASIWQAPSWDFWWD